MESNEQTELTDKTETDIDGEQMTVSEAGRFGGWRDCAKKKKDSWTTVW